MSRTVIFSSSGMSPWVPVPMRDKREAKLVQTRGLELFRSITDGELVDRLVEQGLEATIRRDGDGMDVCLCQPVFGKSHMLSARFRRSGALGFGPVFPQTQFHLGTILDKTVPGLVLRPCRLALDLVGEHDVCAHILANRIAAACQVELERAASVLPPSVGRKHYRRTVVLVN